MVNCIEIINVVIQGLSLVATSAIPFVLLHLDNKNKKLEKKEKNIEEAKKFIMDNRDDLSFITSCIFAYSLNPYQEYVRKIFNNFNMLNDDVKKEVLKILNLSDELIQDNKWVNEGIQIIRKFIEDNKLCNGKGFEINDYLYENAKYLHKSFNEFGKTKYSENMINDEKYNNDVGYCPMLEPELISFSDYYEGYFTNIIINKDPKYQNAESPFVMLYNEEFKSSVKQKEHLCLWVMEIIHLTCTLMINSKYFGIENKIKRTYEYNNRCETYEDKYYQVMIELYNMVKIKNNISN